MEKQLFCKSSSYEKVRAAEYPFSDKIPAKFNTSEKVAALKKLVLCRIPTLKKQLMCMYLYSEQVRPPKMLEITVHQKFRSRNEFNLK